MSAQHTLGRLTTDEAEHDAPYQDIWLMLGNRKVAKLSIDDAPVHDFNAEQRSFARRLVACWNACEGIPTDVLEKAPVAEALWQDLTAQRDELLAALVKFSDAMKGCGDWPDTSSSMLRLAEISDTARAAIAKVKGGAA